MPLSVAGAHKHTYVNCYTLKPCVMYVPTPTGINSTRIDIDPEIAIPCYPP